MSDKPAWMMEKCGDCVFLDAVTGTAITVGACRRFPPTIARSGSSLAEYPLRGSGSQACAEFRHDA